MNTHYLYVYPISDRSKTDLYNPYIDDLIQAIEKYYGCINKHAPSNIGIFNILKYLLKTNYFHLNWIEDLPDKKGGIIQTLFFVSLILLIKITRKKIIWTIHNKLSHSKKRIQIKKWFIKILIKYSDYKITHATDGIKYVEDMTNEKEARKVRYLPHPIKTKPTLNHIASEYDIIIWGTITQYKGVDDFLNYLYENNLHSKYKILIIGKILDKSYEIKIKKYSSNNIKIINKFADEEELKTSIGKSKIILFTYQRQYILSSGALADSIAYGKKVIGPDVGAFKDLKETGFVQAYNNLNELIEIIDQALTQKNNNNYSEIQEFIRANNWPKYAEKLHKWLISEDTN